MGPLSPLAFSDVYSTNDGLSLHIVLLHLRITPLAIYHAVSPFAGTTWLFLSPLFRLFVHVLSLSIVSIDCFCTSLVFVLVLDELNCCS
jgi:hypothetical protein